MTRISGPLIAYLRTFPERETMPRTKMRILARVRLVTGKYNLKPANIVRDAPRPANGPDAAARGLYLAKSSCTECRGANLEGSQNAPALSIVAAYSAEFAKLMRDGVPKQAAASRPSATPIQIHQLRPRVFGLEPSTWPRFASRRRASTEQRRPPRPLPPRHSVSRTSAFLAPSVARPLHRALVRRTPNSRRSGG